MRIALVISLIVCLVAGRSMAQIPSGKGGRTTFSIRAVDDKTMTELPAQFSIRATVANKKFTGVSQLGKPFVFLLTRTDTLDVVTSAPGYDQSEELMVVSCDTCPDYEYTVQLTRTIPRPDSVFLDLRVSQSIRLDNVYFDQSSYVLRPDSYPQLDKLTRTLKTNPGLTIEVAGHTDNVGDRRLNQTLSENRARVIRQYLVRQGISEARLRANGYGDTQPAAPNDSEENKRKNRRVEFVVLSL